MQLARALTFSPDCVVLFDAHDLRILEVNREPAFGYRRHELEALRFTELFAGVSDELIERALLGRHDPHPQAPLRVLCRTREGAEVPVDVRLGKTDDDRRVIAIVRQVSEEARSAERELVGVVCAAPMAIITWTLDGRIMSWNPGAARLYGHAPERAIGASIELLVPESERERLNRAQRRALVEDRLPPALVNRRGAQEIIAVEESLFVIRDVARHPLRFGCFTRSAGAPESAPRRARPAELPSASPAMEEARASAQLAIEASDTPVLLLGETGVGKSWLARTIHEESARSTGPFVEVNCANLDPVLFDSELFGHERGAFTGAVSPKPGLVEAADGGSLFLDEIGEMPGASQAKLLAFLDHGTFRRVGSTHSAVANVRIIAATNIDLEAAVAAKRFREDLYYRLDVLSVLLPPLRERAEDLPKLIRALLPPGKELSSDALALLLGHRWPGNLRELKNVLERAVLHSRCDPIALDHLPAKLRARPAIEPGGASRRRAASEASEDGRAGSAGPGPGGTLEELELTAIQRALAEHGGNRSRAARALGVSRSTLLRRLSQDPLRARVAPEDR